MAIGVFHEMTAREIIAAIPLAIRVGIRSWLALRRGKRFANRGTKAFRRALNKKGLPEEVVDSLTNAYRTNLDFLSIRKLSQFAFQTARQPTKS